MAALALGGCGSGRSADVADTSAAVVAMSEFRLDPQELRLSAGRRAFTIRNDGRIVHRFELRRADGDRRLLVRGRPLKPGESQTLTVRLTPGEYLMRCAQERHNTLGEWGTVTVRG
ncbi:cupredoxin domain-containing protein [Conexibacter arvalis]|uniref:Plastocyanin n=1 Tax=Conexibacter arvalis TaxID=912552 RepID=A0A840IEB2_9ACTN|nr:plastocyanin [Conexibacter arvalis]